MREPRIETISAATSAVTGLLLTAAIIVRPYVFVKCGHAEGLRRAQAGPAGADPRRCAARVRPPWLRGRDRREARRGDRSLPRRDLQLLREQGGALRRARATLL